MDSAELYPKRTPHTVFGDSPSAAKYLVTALKSKHMQPDDITNAFVELFPVHRQGQGELMDYVQALLLELSRTEAPAVITKSVIGAVRFYANKEEGEQWFARAALTNFFVNCWKTLSPMVVNAVASLADEQAIPQKAELLAHAIEVWGRKQRKEAVHFAVDFSLRVLPTQHELESSVSAIETLVSENKIDVLMTLIHGDLGLVAKAIPFLCTNQLVKTAGKLIEDNHLNPSDFPSVVLRMKKVAVRYFVNAHDMEMGQLVDLLSDDSDCLTILVEELEYKYTSKRLNHLGTFAAKVLREFPHIAERLKPSVLSTLQSLQPSDASLFPEDSFSPRDSAALRYPFPIDTVHFLVSEEAVQSLDLTNTDIVALDCEWRPSLIKFQQFPVSLLQMATRDRVYIIDLIALRESTLLNEKLLAAFQNPDITKLGLSFSDDRKLLIKSYPRMSAFHEAMVSYGDLQGIYQQLFSEEEGSGGLAMLCQRFLKVKLCKGEQRSNWEKRPLRLAQLHYAALDAYVEVLIWQQLCAEAKERGDDPLDCLYNLGSPDEDHAPVSSAAGRNPKCGNCGDLGHLKKQCTKGPRCFACQGFGHISASCPKAR